MPGSPLRYAAAGVMNTAAGYTGILILSALGTAPVLANAGGFGLGFVVSLFLARRFTFQQTGRPRANARYCVAFVACWTMNVLLMKGLVLVAIPAALAQGGGVCAYAIAFYLACRWWVFDDGSARRADLAWLRGRR